MSIERIFSRGEALGDFSKIFPRGAKSCEIWLFPIEIKQPFLA